MRVWSNNIPRINKYNSVSDARLLFFLCCFFFLRFLSIAVSLFVVGWRSPELLYVFPLSGTLLPSVYPQLLSACCLLLASLAAVA